MKICNNHQALVVVLNEFFFPNEDMFYKALEFFKMKHPKKGSFAFIHYWFIFKDILRWAKIKQANRTLNDPHEKEIVN